MTDERFDKIYELMAPYTCTPHAGYVTNLLLAESVSEIPGAIVECGVWRGGMIAGIASLLGSDREYYLFDSFEGLPPVEPIDGQFAADWIKDSDHFVVSEDVAKEAMELSGVEKFCIVKGWFADTLPEFQFPNGIAFIRIDGDWYKSMYQVLEVMFPWVSPGGIISIDDYYFLQGAAMATHDYLSGYQRTERIQVITDAQPWERPTDGVAYIVKGN